MKAFIFAMCIATVALADEAAKPAKAAKKAKAPVAISFADVKWAEIPDSHGIMMSPIKGDMMKAGDSDVFVKFPAGSMHPPHTHTATLEVVVLAGSFMFGADEASAKEYGPGSYILVPGGYKHISGCKAECTLFQEGHGKFDMIMPKGEAAPAAAAPADKK